MKVAVVTREDLSETDPTRLKVLEVLKSLGCETVKEKPRGLIDAVVVLYKLEAVIDYSDKNVFPDASTYPVITSITQKINKPYNILTGKFDETLQCN